MPWFAECCWGPKHTSPSWGLAGASEEQKNHEMQGTDRSARSAARGKPLAKHVLKILADLRVTQSLPGALDASASSAMEAWVAA